MELGISGKHALVTGGSSGLGLGIANALAAEGVIVTIASRNEAKLEKAISEIGHGAKGFVCDLSQPENAATLVDQVTSDLGPIDILIANAGGPRPAMPSQLALSDFRLAINQNLLSSVGLCQSVIPNMVERGFGRIIAVTSLYVKAPSSPLTLSNTARTGLTAYLKSLSNEVAPNNITVNSLLPGLHQTQRLIELSGANLQERAKTVPSLQLGDSESFGKVAAFLCSKWAWYITGQAITVDGGLTPGLF
ncbi:SDR family oxidoreductase [Acidithrix ferrooxidans]|uniref:3-oxoacyl-[acyl-carrier-protein] reductase FabG n=1 Tax=Acidithrix ferrooxidans TaxID=1280514 RepID=A0A0D8HK10_9ACTN|nr:SDR family oxidoreductase [Acidithrix ferrooxidans]KJF18273.1 3-oxoacyl-[acyl-carrier-protein] reductase FabG [Acidithrix ferrooxidans]